MFFSRLVCLSFLLVVTVLCFGQESGTVNKMNVGEDLFVNGNLELKRAGQASWFRALKSDGQTEGLMLRSEGVSSFMGGRVGIGTTNPGADLHVSGNVLVAPFSDHDPGGYMERDTELVLASGGIYSGASARIRFGGMYSPDNTRNIATYNTIEWSAGHLRFRTWDEDKMRIGGGAPWSLQNVEIVPETGVLFVGRDRAGNLDADPENRLVVGGSASINGGYRLGLDTAHVNHGHLRYEASREEGRLVVEGMYGHRITTNGQTRLLVKTNGQIGVGTETVPAGYQLAVNGEVIATGLRLELPSAWPDYVFADDYALMPLNEVHQFIQNEKHLPGVPAAAEMAEGIDVAATQVNLMQKVEELTLYLIQQNEKIQALEARLEAMQ